MQVEPFSEERVKAIIAGHAAVEGPLLPILHAVQAAFGHVPEAVTPIIAEELNLSRAEVHGVITFYHDFHCEPRGRTVLRMCRAEACQSMGCEKLIERAEDKLGIECGETSADGRVTLEGIYCLGLCSTAPAMEVNGRLIGRLTPARLENLLAEIDP